MIANRHAVARIIVLWDNICVFCVFIIHCCVYLVIFCGCESEKRKPAAWPRKEKPIWNRTIYISNIIIWPMIPLLLIFTSGFFLIKRKGKLNSSLTKQLECNVYLVALQVTSLISRKSFQGLKVVLVDIKETFSAIPAEQSPDVWPVA